MLSSHHRSGGQPEHEGDEEERALSLQQVPPTSVLNGIALFMTIFIMFPTLQKVYNNSIKPLSDGRLTIEEAYREAENPLREFMLRQTITVQSDGSLGSRYISSFLKMANLPSPKGYIFGHTQSFLF